MFFDREGDGKEPRAEIPREAIPGRGAEPALFRAIRLEKEDPEHREYLAARARWRTSPVGRYRYEVRWNWSFFSLHGTVTVVDGHVTASETIMSFPMEIEPPALLTIDGWFDKVADARARDAEIIDVDWHPEFGVPSTGFIDLSRLIADEEQSWTIDSFTPLL